MPCDMRALRVVSVRAVWVLIDALRSDWCDQSMHVSRPGGCRNGRYCLYAHGPAPVTPTPTPADGLARPTALLTPTVLGSDSTALGSDSTALGSGSPDADLAFALRYQSELDATRNDSSMARDVAAMQREMQEDGDTQMYNDFDMILDHRLACYSAPCHPHTAAV